MFHSIPFRKALHWLQALDKMGANPAFGAGFKGKVTKNFVTRETDVKQVAATIQLWEGDAGAVFATDITSKMAPDVRVVEIPDSLNVVGEYPIGLVNDGEVSHLELAFVDFIVSDEGQSIPKEHGFLPGDKWLGPENLSHPQ